MATQKKTEKEIANDKANRILEGVAIWAAFYRHNPQRFAKEYLNINLKLFQKILLYAMMLNNYFMYIAARGQGKTFLVALFCVCRCILFPRTKICVASSTRVQANEVLLKIRDDFMKNYGSGSENLRREIIDCKISQNDSAIYFLNGSWIQVVTASDSGRGKRANIVVIDEFRMVDKTTIDTVIRRFLTTPRQPGYLRNPKYANMLERNKEIYMSSAWYANHWSFEKAKSYFIGMLDPTKKYFVCSLPYQISIKEGLLSKEQIEDEMAEKDFDETKFSMEMESLFYGDSDGAFFKFEDVSARRKLKVPMFPPLLMNKQYKIPDIQTNERRIMSVDIALMASKKHNNDATAIVINRAIPKSDNTYTANIVYMENFEGLNVDELALIIRRMYKTYKCTDLVLDTAGSGLGVYDMLIKDIIDPESGELYPALSCCNDKEMADRCRVSNARKVIWSIKGNASFNNEICVGLRSGFKMGKINLLIHEDLCEKALKETVSSFNRLSAQEQMVYKMPYIQTGLLVNELTKLEYEVKGTNVKVKERSGMRKDRYSSIAYNYWVQCQLERELTTNNNSFSMKDFAKKIGMMNKAPNRY